MVEEERVKAQREETEENLRWIRDSIARSEQEHEQITKLLKRSRKRLEALSCDSGH
jgi:hypothetical protein